MSGLDHNRPPMRPSTREVVEVLSEVVVPARDHAYLSGMRLVMRLITDVGVTTATSGSWARGINVPIVPRNPILSIL
jgi:hypothetical protein